MTTAGQVIGGGEELLAQSIDLTTMNDLLKQ